MEIIKAHENSPKYKRFRLEFRPDFYTDMDNKRVERPYTTCSYCGSLSFEDALKAFQTPGMRWSGADWKYGWPHKFYLEIPCEPYEACISGHYNGETGEQSITRAMKTSDHKKFYNEHLQDVSAEQLQQWNDIVGPITGVRFHWRDGRFQYFAVPNRQGFGTIGGESGGGYVCR